MNKVRNALIIALIVMVIAVIGTAFFKSGVVRQNSLIDSFDSFASDMF